MVVASLMALQRYLFEPFHGTTFTSIGITVVEVLVRGSRVKTGYCFVSSNAEMRGSNCSPAMQPSGKSYTEAGRPPAGMAGGGLVLSVLGLATSPRLMKATVSPFTAA